mgnify:CR=1 FL=1
MRCPYCREGDSRVIDTRPVGDAIRRRRECLACGRRFTTYERRPVRLVIVKRDSRREEFDRDKLAGGIFTACAKRPISVETIESLVERVQTGLLDLGKAEVESRVVGEMVMDELRGLDDVAYVRFASVYRRFKDVDGLVEEIKEFKKWKQGAGGSKPS